MQAGFACSERRMENMFDNIGGKLKGLAKVICWLGIIVTAISGLLVMVNGNILEGILAIVVGCLFSWIGSWALYGFGQLIENTDRMTSALEKRNVE